MASNQASASTSASSSLNPASRHDYDKQRTRDRNHPLRGMKSSSILTRKLERGFNVTWINGGSKPQAVNLSTNSDKSYLRIRMHSRDEEESENDGSKANQRDIKFKVRHIAKIGSEKESTSEKRIGDKPKNKIFVIKMKYTVGEFSKFKFLAQSLAERDSVLLAIQSLMGKRLEGSLPSKNQSIEYEMQPNQVNLKSFKALRINEVQNDMAEEETDSFNIPVPKSSVYPIDNDIFFDSRDDNGYGRIEDSERDTADAVGHNIENNSFQRENVQGKAYDSSHYKSTKHQTISHTTKVYRNKPSTWMEKTNRDNNGRAAKKYIATPGRNRQHQSTSKVNHNQQKPRTHKVLEHQRNHPYVDRAKSSVKEMTDFEFQSQALSALKDGDIANLAADFTNPVTGPWCTDDVCTASLKDFADSMTGIFDLKDNRQLKGVSGAKKNQRAIAEEYISGLLGNNSNMSELLSVKDLWNVAAMNDVTGNELKKRRLHNRARNSNGKATRLMSLRKQMTFQGADTRNTTSLQTVSSFDDVDRKVKGDMDDCELLYYDSDPEDTRERTMTRGPRGAMARREETNQSNAKRREALDILDTSRFGLGRKWKRLGRDVLSDIIEATKNEKLTLLWHPTQNTENNNMPPVCVKVWVESGVYLNDGSFLLPKLTWLPAHEKNLESRVLNVSDGNPGSLELLDVCRVRECHSIDRRLHPFALVDRSFIIQTQNRRYMFEAQSKQERGRVVNGLKLVIARLASLLMLKDLRAVEEFFSGSAVPGEAPIWARDFENGESDNDFPSA